MVVAVKPNPQVFSSKLVLQIIAVRRVILISYGMGEQGEKMYTL